MRLCGEGDFAKIGPISFWQRPTHVITPEYVLEERGVFVFVANHDLSSDAKILQSTEYNRARILHARNHLPDHLSICRLVYDIRGQRVSSAQFDRIKATLGDLAAVEFKS